MRLSVKNTLRAWTYRSARNHGLYRYVWHPIGRFAQLAQREHEWAQLQVDNSADLAERRLSETLVTRTGPFAGLRYPSRTAVGSAFLPKLLGSYEQELHPVVNVLDTRDYGAVYDVGCDEGYYAIGLARLLKSVQIYAYDTVPAARDLCAAMATLNGVADRVSVRAHCGPSDLMSIAVDHALIWCDCEGYERYLFDRSVAAALSAHDVLIEVHDFIHPFLTDHLRDAFKATHRLDVIRTVPDMLRPTIYPHPAVSPFSPDMQISLMGEHRPAAMKWFWFTPRDRPSPPLAPIHE